MARLYIDNDMARFTRKDICLVDVELYDGRTFENLEPRRLFPTTGLEKYITLLDSTGVETASMSTTWCPRSQRSMNAGKSTAC